MPVTSLRGSLPLNTFVQGSVHLVGVNLTLVRMGLTDIWADWEVPLGYWYGWTPTSQSQATSGTGSIALWMQFGHGWSASAFFACKGRPLVLHRVNSEAGAVLRSPLWMNLLAPDQWWVFLPEAECIPELFTLTDIAVSA